MKTIMIATMLASVTVLASCGKEEEAVQPAHRLVDVVVVAEQAREQGATITGDVRARVQSDISFRVGGKIIERLVDVGMPVKAGQLLARIDPQEQQADLEIAQASLQSAEAQRVQAQQNFDRQSRLFQTHVTSRSSLDAAQEALLTAQSAVHSAQANLEVAKDALSYTDLRADADGVITARSAEVGQVTQAAQTVFTLAHDGSRDAVFGVYESLFLGRTLEDKVSVTLLSDRSRKVDANIREISPTIDASTGTIRVKVGLNGDRSMPLGAAVAGFFRFKSEKVISLPWSAMASKDGHPAIWVVNPQTSQVEMRMIEIADHQTGQFVVRSGLAPGDIVVSGGAKFLRANEIVTYQKEQAQ